jgi:archaellum biogenesis ATPase FlaH
MKNDDFLQWRDNPQKRLLWIRGDPGKGKTMLLCGIIDELDKEAAYYLSYFFCQATQADLSTAIAILRGLIYRLILQQPWLISHLRAKYDTMGAKLFQNVNTWVSLTGILTAILKSPALEDVVLVIDALDECITDQAQLLDFIADISVSSHAKWVISSRNEQAIEDKLGRTQQKATVSLELNPDSISEAVRIYIDDRVARLTKEKDLSNKSQEIAKTYHLENSKDTFLWVALVCQALADEKVKERHLEETLKSCPPTLNSLYRRMLGLMHESRDADYCKKILATACVVYRPITLKELTSLIESLNKFKGNEVEEIIKSCGSFLTLRDDVIYFVHQSAKDFLLRATPNQDRFLDVTRQHHSIFARSLAILSTLRRDIYNIHRPGLRTSEIKPPNPDPMDAARYSNIYWVDHLRDSGPKVEGDKDLDDDGAVHDFLKTKYLHWLEAMSLLGKMSNGVTAMLKLQALVVRLLSPPLYKTSLTFSCFAGYERTITALHVRS